ncbi:YceI family protein [Dyadobacter sp. CY343]|uniref:YceI family protein n=1 Tax=Dyadobacter sp. CY343 TaxID=2907299 RepID=UPI001F1CB3ED|nr:YceI family protein [Dyadobacter sp. CY343]MCE7060503.1 YceI family protein [Dyadobacter sp. CY343]
MKKWVIVSLALLLASFTLVLLNSWKIAPGFTIKFEGKYAQGTFGKMNGTIEFDPKEPEKAVFDVAVEVASIETGNDLKNKHARSEKWFAAEKFPLIRFKSSTVMRADSGYLVTGDLEVRGIKKEVSIPFIFNEKGAAFHGHFKVNRGDFGIGKVTGKASDSTAVEIYVPVFQQ